MLRRACSVARRGVVGNRHRGVIEAGGARYEYEIALCDGAAVADLGLKGRTGTDELGAISRVSWRCRRGLREIRFGVNFADGIGEAPCGHRSG